MSLQRRGPGCLVGDGINAAPAWLEPISALHWDWYGLASSWHIVLVKGRPLKSRERSRSTSSPPHHPAEFFGPFFYKVAQSRRESRVANPVIAARRQGHTSGRVVRNSLKSSTSGPKPTQLPMRFSLHAASQ